MMEKAGFAVTHCYPKAARFSGVIAESNLVQGNFIADFRFPSQNVQNCNREEK
jgi:hypothetical protein